MMTVNEGLRLIAGVMLLISLALGVFVHQNWFYFTAFLGVNLIQSAFTGWCPMVWLLTKLGFKQEQAIS